MIYKYNKGDKNLQPVPFKNADTEKELEDLLAKNLSELYIEDGQLMPIFQEKQGQEEPDMCALDKNGNIVLFELKKGEVPEKTTLQILRYLQIWGKRGYSQINQIYQSYSKDDKELKKAHQEIFQLEKELNEEQFNRNQRLIIIGSSSDISLIENIDFWKKKGLDIDFLPYRFFEINKEVYLEFFAKPYDYHINPNDIKGIIFDTNRSYDEEALWDMIGSEKISAYGEAARFVDRFSKDDYVFYYHAGYGIVGAGVIASVKTFEDSSKKELYKKVKLSTPKIKNMSEIKYLSPKEIKSILNKDFWWSSTVKVPYLTKDDSEKLLSAIKSKYENNGSDT